MKTLILKEYGTTLRTRRGLLVVENKDRRQELSPGDIDQVLIPSGGVSVTSRAVR